jgi:trimeric autotransporter adhesin
MVRVLQNCRTARCGPRRLTVSTRRSLLLAALVLACVLNAAVIPGQAWAVECNNGGQGPNPAGDDGNVASDTACGQNADASGGGGNTAIGNSANASGTGLATNTAVGNSSDASGAAGLNTAIGDNANASGEAGFNTAVGAGAFASGAGSHNVAVGD